MVVTEKIDQPAQTGEIMLKDEVGRLDLNLILVFDALLRHRNVSRAATSLQVTQSAVSHSLRRMRTYFDDRLFARTALGVTPTAKALELSAPISQIAELVRSGLLSRAAFKPEAANRTLTLCMTDLGEFALLPTLIAALRDASPGCTLRAVQGQPSEVRAMLESGEADITIGAIPPGEGEIYGQKLYTQSSVVIVHRDTVRGDALSLEDYCDMPHISVSPVRGRPTMIDEGLARLGRRRRIVVTTEHHLVIPYLIEADPTLIASAARMMSEVCARHEALRVLELPVELPGFDVFQYWHARSHQDPFHIWCRNLITQFFQHHPVLDTGR
jgi:DNA-binding transcriptional LysR family regulator